MYDVMILRDSGACVEELAARIACAYTCKVRSLEEVTRDEAADAAVVIVFSELRRSIDVDRLGKLFRPSYRIANMIYVAPGLERAGIVQAEALGLGRVHGPHKTVDDVLRGVREILSRELARRLSEFPQAVNKAVEVSDTFQTGLAAAMRQSRPLPLGPCGAPVMPSARRFRRRGLQHG